ncbi:MAG: glycine zipper 2TM domain-containing protein [Alphaproteobacteria bacterium]|nr:glycine zipper 2TM domain-containing protein [Alphaproteobacteria bacterium]OJV12545.1 MAG: hypothetical protein BGO27_03375 [Alphaproteobacteria bacterium 33-17]
MKKKVATLIISLSVITACENGSMPISRQHVATGLGAIGGGILGSNIGKGKGRMVGAALGALGGAAFGNWMGEHLDPKDQQTHINTTQRSLENARTNQQIGWDDPDTGASGFVMPTQTYKSREGRVCREYTQVIQVDGKRQEAFGKACRNNDGYWQIQN